MRNCFLLLFLIFIGLSQIFAVETLFYGADKIEYETENKRFKLNGHCFIDYGDIHLTADTIYFFNEKKIIYALGNVFIKNGSSSFYSEALKYDMDKKRLYFKYARIPMENGYLVGKAFSTKGENIVFGKDAIFTTCNKPDPDYKIKTNRLKFIKDDKVFFSPVIFYIGNVPVFYFPSYFFPVYKGRRTGFLQPSFSNSSVDGITVTLPFFLVLNRYSDFTYTFKYMSVRGTSHSGVFRYKNYHGNGNVELFYIEDNIQKMNRWNLKGNFLQFFDKNRLKATGVVNFSSDSSFFSDFGETLDERAINDINSYITFSRKFGSFLYFRTNINYNKRWERFGEQYLERSTAYLPQINFTLQNTPLFWNLYLSNSTTLYSYYINERFNKGVFSDTLSFSHKNTVFKYFNFSETLSNRFDYYFYEDKKQNRWVPTFNMNGYFKIYGYFNFLNIGATNKIKHIITPSLRYTFTPDMPQERFEHSGESVIVKANRLSYFLTNDFFAKTKDNGTKRFLAISNGVAQDFNNDGKFSQISNSLVFSPYISHNFSTKFRLNYMFDPVTRTDKSLTASNEIRFYLNSSNKINMNLFYQKGYSGANDILTGRFSLNFNLTKDWNVATTLIYDFSVNKFREQSMTLKRDLHCWTMNVSWEDRMNGSIVYKFVISLNGFGDMKWNYGKTIKNLEAENDW